MFNYLASRLNFRLRRASIQIRLVSDQFDWQKENTMRSVGAYEAKTHLAELLNRVTKGETITITRHGHPVAVLAPPAKRNTRSVAEVIAELREFGKKHRLRGASIRKLIDEGRR